MIYFRATDDQMRTMMANAVNASRPVGMGHFQFDASKRFEPSEFQVTPKGCFLDYVQGRMVKFAAWPVGPSIWKAHKTIGSDFESWIGRYPSYAELAQSSGAEVLTEEEAERLARQLAAGESA